MKTTPKFKRTDNPRPEAPPMAEQSAAAQTLAAAMPFNAGKAQEFGRQNAVEPPRGASVASNSPTATASTLSEPNVSAKAAALNDA